MAEINSRQALYRCLDDTVTISSSPKSIELFRYFETGEYADWSIKLYITLSDNSGNTDYLEIRLNNNSSELQNGVYHIDYAKISFNVIFGHKNIENNISGYYICIPSADSRTISSCRVKKDINYGTLNKLLSVQSDVTSFDTNNFFEISTDVNSQVFSILNKDLIVNGNTNISGDTSITGNLVVNGDISGSDDESLTFTSPILIENNLTVTNDLKLNNLTSVRVLGTSDQGVLESHTLVSSDIPDLDTSKITSGVFSIERGGTGASSAVGALSNLGGVGIVNASGTAPLTLSANKTGTTVTITGSVANASSTTYVLNLLFFYSFTSFKLFTRHEQQTSKTWF